MFEIQVSASANKLNS